VSGPKYNKAYKNVVAQVQDAPHYFAMLGVSVRSTENELRAARKALATYLHPDVNGDPLATALMSEVNAAHATLQDKVLRTRYMGTLSQKPCGACEGDGVLKKQRGFSAVTKVVCPTCKGSGRA